MIILSNGHKMEYVVASGALAFDGKGWLWERPLVWMGLIKPESFSVVLKTLTFNPRSGFLRWWKPWECVRLIPGGSVNKIGLTNKGIKWWCKKVGPKLDFKKYSLVGSIFGNQEELVKMAGMFNKFDFVAVEINPSCPNTGHALDETDVIIKTVKAVKGVSEHPIIVKISAAQDYLTIADRLKGIAEAIDLNSVPWEMVYPKSEKSPLCRLEQRVGGGGGGVSGKPSRIFNWKAVKELSEQGSLPVIGPSIMDFDDFNVLRELGASALSFGAIHLRTPWRPTAFVRRDQNEKAYF
jgi:dihydroorotate dehydrogenase